METSSLTTLRAQTGKIDKPLIRIKDNGRGIPPAELREALTSFGASKTADTRRSGDFNTREHGMGLKLNALRLGRTCLIMTKSKAPNKPNTQHFQIGLLSLRFLQDASCDYLVAPMLAYEIREKTTFVPVTPQSKQIFRTIQRYSKPLFCSEE